MEMHGKLTRIEANEHKTLATVTRASQEHGRNFTQYMTDIATTGAVEAALVADAGIDSRNIHVDTYDNTVTLTGQAATPSEKTRAAALVSERENADRLINRLGVRRPH